MEGRPLSEEEKRLVLLHWSGELDAGEEARAQELILKNPEAFDLFQDMNRIQARCEALPRPQRPVSDSVAADATAAVWASELVDGNSRTRAVLVASLAALVCLLAVVWKTAVDTPESNSTSSPGMAGQSSSADQLAHLPPSRHSSSDMLEADQLDATLLGPQMESRMQLMKLHGLLLHVRAGAPRHLHDR